MAAFYRRLLQPTGTASWESTIVFSLVVGICSSVIAIPWGLGLEYFVPKNRWGDSAANGLASMSLAMVFFAGVIFAPLFETLVGQALPIELAKKFTDSKAIMIAVSGAVFGVGHYVNGGVVHGLSALLHGSLFAYSFVVARKSGFRYSFASAALTHAVHNAIVLSIGLTFT